MYRHAQEHNKVIERFAEKAAKKLAKGEKATRVKDKMRVAVNDGRNEAFICFVEHVEGLDDGGEQVLEREQFTIYLDEWDSIDQETIGKMIEGRKKAVENKVKNRKKLDFDAL